MNLKDYDDSELFDDEEVTEEEYEQLKKAFFEKEQNLI